MNTMNPTRPISLLVCALGGEGGGVLTEWLVEAAHRAGYPCQSTSIPGVAQRTGATTYYVEVFPQHQDQLRGRRPVFSLNPVPGALDAMVSSELLETARQVCAGMASPERTLVLSASGRTLTTAERMQMGDGRMDSAALLKLVQAHSREHHVFDMATMARESGTVVSAVMLGAVAGSGLFPMDRSVYEAVIRAGGKGVEASLRGFSQAFEHVQRSRAQTGYVNALLAPETSVAPSRPALPAELAVQFPVEIHPMLALGHARLCEYQGPAYAAQYAQRLAQVLQAERAARPDSDHQGFAITGEMARWLALWMAFDDIVRVADLKSRASRWQRIRQEVKAGEDDLLMVYDHFKPGVPEFAGLLPAGLARRLLAWDARRQSTGREPWSLRLKIGTHSVTGMVMLRLLANMKWLRARGSRFQEEQRLIARWLDAVVQGTQRSWALGHELAQCGRLIKGYGSTNERGKDNLLHIIDHLAQLPDADTAAHAIAKARNAALADEAGRALDATLTAHGAPPRPLKAQPIRWTRPPKGLNRKRATT